MSASGNIQSTSTVRRWSDGLGVSRGLRALRRFHSRQTFAVWFGLVPIVVLFVAAAFPGVLAPYDPFAQDANALYESPSWSHPMGTDNVGSDVLSRVIYGARATAIIGVVAALGGTAIAVFVGMTSAFAGGVIDSVIQRVVDAFMAFPGLILLLLFVAAFGQGQVVTIASIALFVGVAPSRVFRGAALTIREEQYILAATSVGASWLRIVMRHVFPNLIPLMIVLFTVSIGTAILIEASLAFLGLGVPPPNASWGYSIGGIGRVAVLRAPWVGLFPGLALAATVFAFNILGDGLRDFLDPRLRQLA